MKKEKVPQGRKRMRLLEEGTAKLSFAFYKHPIFLCIHFTPPFKLLRVRFFG